MSSVKKLKRQFRKFRKYYKEIDRYEIKARLRKKVLKLVNKIGILSKPVEIALVDPQKKKRLFPCHLGIIFLGKYEDNIFLEIRNHLEMTYHNFFYTITNLGSLNLNEDLLKKGVKRKNKDENVKSKKMELHPTNKFYQILIDKRIEKNLDMIVAITDLPLYSSSDTQIVFLYGEAHLKHSCCVVSTIILKEEFYNKHKNEDIFESRVVKETLHEVGHLILDTAHCGNKNCVMKFSSNIKDIDYKSYSLCDSCRAKLGKLRVEYNF